MKLIPVIFALGLHLLSYQASLGQGILQDFALVDTLAMKFLQETNLPGVSIAVSKQSEIVYSKGFGYADLEASISMSPSTQLRTASVAKVITATALGRLVTLAKLDLDEPIKTYVPYLKPPFADLTTRQLAGHTAGVQHRPPKRKVKNKQYTTIRETIALFESTKLLFTPDTDYQYSTNGYNLISAVIEGASGKTYAEFMKADIFTPLEMHQTFPENVDELTSNDAKLYYFRKDRLRLDRALTNGSYKLAGAGFRSTPSDLVKMMNAYSNGFISSAVVNEMFKSHQLANGEKTQVGIGWRTSFDAFGNALVEHAGSWQGARTVLVHYPKEALNVAIMINAQCQIFIEETAHLIAQSFLQESVQSSAFSGFDREIAVTINRSDGTVEYSSGNVVLNANKKGTLTVETDIEFLKSSPIQYVGIDNHYAVVTSFGLMYLDLTMKPELTGKLYMYQNRNPSNPVNNKPALSFVEKGE